MYKRIRIVILVLLVMVIVPYIVGSIFGVCPFDANRCVHYIFESCPSGYSHYMVTWGIGLVLTIICLIVFLLLLEGFFDFGKWLRKIFNWFKTGDWHWAD